MARSNNSWTGAAGACLTSSSVRRRVHESAPPGSTDVMWIQRVLVHLLTSPGNIVSFHAPQYVSEDMSCTEDVFKAESRLSEFLAAGLTNSVFEVGPAFEEIKVTSIARKVRVNVESFWVSVSSKNSIGDWAVFISSIHGPLSRIGGRWDSAEMKKLCQVIDEVLRTDKSIEEIEWRTIR